MFETALSTNGKSIGEELFRQYQEAGIGMAELSFGAVGSEKLVDLREVKRFADQYGVKIWSFHLPFMPFLTVDISSTDENLRENSVCYLTELMKKAYEETGVRLFVIHPSGEPIEEASRKSRMDCAKESLKTLAAAAEKIGAVIAVEDLPRTCLGRDSDELLELLSADDRLRVCFDTNHLLKENNVDFIRRVGSKIVTLHVSDYDVLDEKHWLPGEGRTDWQALVKALRTVGYQGPWLYEVGFKCPKTLFRSRDLCCMDFARNAQEILNGREITVIR